MLQTLARPGLRNQQNKLKLLNTKPPHWGGFVMEQFPINIDIKIKMFGILFTWKIKRANSHLF